MGDPKMCSQRFVLLLVWCGLLSVAVVVLSVTQLTTRKNTQDQAKDNLMKQNKPESQFSPCSQTAGRPISHIHHIHLTILDSNLTLEDELLPHFASTSRSLVLKNNSVYVNTAGLYHLYAQVTFAPVPKEKRTVTLIANATPGKEERILSEAVGWGDREGSISISQTISCLKGQSLRLEISPRISFRHNAHHTYWGLFLLTAY